MQLGGQSNCRVDRVHMGLPKFQVVGAREEVIKGGGGSEAVVGDGQSRGVSEAGGQSGWSVGELCFGNGGHCEVQDQSIVNKHC